MSFRTLLAVVLGVAVAVISAFVLIAAGFLRTEVEALLPQSVVLEVDSPLSTLLIGQSIAVIVFALVIAFTIFMVASMYIARPLKTLARAMDAYAQDGTRADMPDIAEAPTEVRSLAASFTSLIDKVEEAHKRDTDISRVKSDFISTAAHQLRTPLTGIRWALEALMKEELTENQKALVSSAADKSKDLVAIVGTLLDISSIESGKYKYTFAPTDMEHVAQSLIQDFMPKAQSAKVSLFLYKEEGASRPPPARADQERVKWVLGNLIDNAIDYTPEGGTVRVSVESAERRVFIRVRDTGIGILPEDRANIFERFYRSSNAIAKKNAGNGLGLYIARTIATDHGGELHFAPNEGGPGTTFTLSLPVA